MRILAMLRSFLIAITSTKKIEINQSISHSVNSLQEQVSNWLVANGWATDNTLYRVMYVAILSTKYITIFLECAPWFTLQ